MRVREAAAGMKAGKKNLQFVRERKAFMRRKRVRASPLGGLQLIAERLNDLSDLQTVVAGQDCAPVEKEECEAWTLVKTIASIPSLSRAGKAFTSAAAQYPVNMVVEVKRGIPRAIVSSRDVIGTALWHLWLYYFCDRGWERLKTCQFCHNWFVDTSNNKAQARCSSACTWKWWSRDRRKKMHHRMKGVKPYAGRQNARPR